MRKKLISMLLLVAMVISVFPVTAFAASPDTVTVGMSTQAIKTRVGFEETLTANVQVNGIALQEQPAMKWDFTFTKADGTETVGLVAESASSIAGASVTNFMALVPGTGTIKATYLDENGQEIASAETTVDVKKPITLSASETKTVNVKTDGEYSAFNGATSVTSDDDQIATAEIAGDELTITAGTKTGVCYLTVDGKDEKVLPVYVDAHHEAWQSYLGKATITVETNAEPKPYSGETPTMPQTETNTFKFVDWQAPITMTAAECPQNILHVANFMKQATVTWNVNGKATDEVYDFGATPAFKGSTDKAEDDKFTYEFAGWDPAIKAVDGHITYTAKYNAIEKGPAPAITLDKDKLNMEKGDTQKITATAPADTKLVWTSDKETVATVDQNGTVTAVAAGTAVITCKSEDGSISATCTVTVTEKAPTPAITLDKDKLNMEKGDTQKITATAPAGTKLVWTSDKETVATVDKTGTVTAVAAGTAVITCKSEDSSLSATCTVTVTEKAPAPAITLDQDKLELEKGDTQKITATAPADTKLVWTSDKETVATVDQNGVVTAVAEGTAVITCKSEDGSLSATCTVTVTDNNGTSHPTIDMEVGDTAQLEDPNPDGKNTWTSDDETVATVDQNGVVTAVGVGTAVIICKNEDGLVIDQYTVVVTGAKRNIVWVVDGKLTTETYVDGDMPEFKGSLEKPGYAFMNWEPALETVTKDQIYTATFIKEEDVPQPYKIIWMINGAFTEETYLEGDMPEFKGETPAMEGYVFEGWKPEIKPVVGNQVYTAQFSKEKSDPVQHTITWMVNGVTTTSLCNEGDVPVFNGSTMKDPTVANTYKFIGWDKPLAPCTGNATYVAQYETEPRYYVVTWVVEGDVFAQSYPYGSTPVFAGEPSKENTNTHTYRFAGWDPKLNFVTEDATYTAVFEETEVKFDITWKDHTGKVIRVDQVKYGEKPDFGETPKRPSENGIPYTFKGWEPAVVAATENATYTANYEKGTGNETFHVVFKDWNGKTLDSQKVKPGSKLVYGGETPVRPTENDTRYVFKGWDPDISKIKTVEEDLTFVAQYTSSDATELVLDKNTIDKNASDKDLDYVAYDFVAGTLYVRAETFQAMKKLDMEFVVRMEEDLRKDTVDLLIYELDDGVEILYTDEIPGLTLFANSLSDGNVVAVSNDKKHRNYTNEVFSIITDDGAYARVPGTCRLKTVNAGRSFADVNPYDWFFSEVNFVAAREIMIGTSATTFEPMTNVTRAQALQIVYRLAGQPTTKNGVAYNDFDPNGWYAKAAYWATGNNMLPARSDKQNCYGINDVIFREDQALLLYNFAKSIGMPCDEKASLNKFQDANTLSDSDHVRAMEWAVGAGIINGRSTSELAPQGLTNRAEMSAMLARYVSYLTIPDMDTDLYHTEDVHKN